MGLWYKFALASVGLLAVVCNGQKMQMIMKKGQRCPGAQYAKLPITVEKLTYTPNPETGSLAMSGIVTIKKNVTKIILELEISRCLTEDLDSCVKFIALNCTNVCEQMGKKDKIWTTLIRSMKDFPNDCPVPAGRYEARNGYIDLQKGHELFGIPPGHWLTRVTFFDKEEILFCHWSMAIVKRNRKRKTQT